jgi:hypothetical protein
LNIIRKIISNITTTTIVIIIGRNKNDSLPTTKAKISNANNILKIRLVNQLIYITVYFLLVKKYIIVNIFFVSKIDFVVVLKFHFVK